MSANRKAVQAYFDGLNNKDLSKVPYADDAILWAPLAPNGLKEPIRGKDAIIDYLEGVFPILGLVEVQKLMEDGEWACGRAFIHLTKPAGAMLRVNDAFRMVDGEIVEQENHFDPRPAMT